MEQITKRDGYVYYGEHKCADIDDAYERFRMDYHKSLGRKTSWRLDRIGRRRERIHGFGCVFTDESAPREQQYFPRGRQKIFLLGLVDIHYFWIMHLEDNGMTDDQQFDYIDWLMMKGNKTLMFVDRKKKNTGRTSKRLNARIK